MKCGTRVACLLWLAFLAAPIGLRAQDAAPSEARQLITEGVIQLLQEITLMNGSAANAASEPTTLGVIARPSLGNTLDAGLDFNNQDGTLTVTLAPFLLLDPWADYRYANTRLTLTGNTEQANVTAGLRWDFTQRDPRFYFSHVADLDAIDAEIVTAEQARCASFGTTTTEEEDAAKLQCLAGALNEVVDAHLKKAEEGRLGVSLAANVSRADGGGYDGSTATLAGEWIFRPFSTTKSGPGLLGLEIPLVVNGRWEDARPKDAGSDADRDRQAGGGVEVSLDLSVQAAGAPRRFGIGLATSVLECVQSSCQNDQATLRLNPFVALGLSKSVAGRLDFVWEGSGTNLRAAVAGLKLDYAFTGL